MARILCVLGPRTRGGRGARGGTDVQGQEVGGMLKAGRAGRGALEEGLGVGRWPAALLSELRPTLQGAGTHSLLGTLKTNYSYCTKPHICRAGI